MAYKKRTTSKRAKLKKQRKTDNEYITDYIMVYGLIKGKQGITGNEIMRIAGINSKRLSMVIMELVEAGIIEPIED